LEPRSRRIFATSAEATYDLASRRGLSQDRRSLGLPLACHRRRGEVPDVLVQTRRNKRSRSIDAQVLKKYGFVQTSSSRMISDLMRCSGHLGSQNVMNAVDGATIERRIRISQLDEGAQDARFQERGIRATIPLSACSTQNTLTSSAISPQQERTEPPASAMQHA